MICIWDVVFLSADTFGYSYLSLYYTIVITTAQNSGRQQRLFYYQKTKLCLFNAPDLKCLCDTALGLGLYMKQYQVSISFNSLDK